MGRAYNPFGIPWIFSEKIREDRRFKEEVFTPLNTPTITLHKPHPGRIVKMYVINDVLEFLKKERLI
jgi:hypothetical protein